MRHLITRELLKRLGPRVKDDHPYVRRIDAMRIGVTCTECTSGGEHIVVFSEDGSIYGECVGCKSYGACRHIVAAYWLYAWYRESGTTRNVLTFRKAS